jgi:hypothetical protein
MPKTFARRAYDESTGMSRAVMNSGLDWIIVRFLAPKDGPAKGNVRHGFYGTDELGFGRHPRRHRRIHRRPGRRPSLRLRCPGDQQLSAERGNRRPHRGDRRGGPAGEQT